MSVLNNEQTSALRHCSEHGHTWVVRGDPLDQYCSCCGYPRQNVAITAGGWAFDELRDAILRVNELATGNWVQTAEERLRRIGILLDKVIDNDPPMREFLGR